MMRASLPSDRFTVSRMLMRTLADGRRTWDPVKINRSIALVEQFIQQQPGEADEVLFNAMLDTHSRSKDIARLESTYQRMKDLGVEASHVTLGILVKAYGQVCDIKKVLQLWDEMKDQREQANAVTYGCMINACVKCSQTEKALQIFRDMQKRHKQCNTILYTTLIKGYGNEKDLSTAIMLFREMRNEGVPYNTIAYNSIIDVCIKCSEVSRAEEFFQEMMSDTSTVQPDLITYSTLLKGYCQVGELDKALQVAATIKACGMQCDELVYNTLMDGCVKANDLSAGVGLFAEMTSAGMKPSSITHSIFLRLYQRNGYKGNALDAVAQLYQHHGLEKPSGTVEKASKAAARRENRTKGNKPRPAKAAAKPKSAGSGLGAPINPGPQAGPAMQPAAWQGHGQMQPVPVGHQAWPVPAFGRAVPVAPVPAAAQPGGPGFVDASQRMPGAGGYMMPMNEVNYGIPSRPATFAGMALDDLYQRQNGRQNESGFASPERGPQHEPISPHQFRVHPDPERDREAQFQAPVRSLQKDIQRHYAQRLQDLRNGTATSSARHCSFEASENASERESDRGRASGANDARGSMGEPGQESDQVDQLSCGDDITAFLLDIVRVNEVLRKQVESGAQEHITADFIKRRGESHPTAIPMVTAWVTGEYHIFTLSDNTIIGIPQEKGCTTGINRPASVMEKGDSSTAAGIVRLGREAHMSSPSRSGVQSPGEATVAGIACTKSKRPLKSIRALVGTGERLKSKEGRLRGTLMGKRVDFCARSVIGGDPNLDTEQVGVPRPGGGTGGDARGDLSIALNLSFPERVTPLPEGSWVGPTLGTGWEDADHAELAEGGLEFGLNVAHMKKLVVNGPIDHPGRAGHGEDDEPLVGDEDWLALQRSMLEEFAAKKESAEAAETCMPTEEGGTEATASSDGDVFQVRRIDFLGEEVPILLQNRNGPCALLAIANGLLLRGAWNLGQRETSISSRDLLGRLGFLCDELNFKAMQEDFTLAQKVRDVISSLPKLLDGLLVNCDFGACGSFEDSSSRGLFELFRLQLFHVWVDLEVHKVVPTWNDLMDLLANSAELRAEDRRAFSEEEEETLTKAALLEEWLEANRAQATQRGILELQKQVKTGDICVLFRNNHFCTVYKPGHNSPCPHCCMLLTDECFSDESSPVWETLVFGEGQFLDAQFCSMESEAEDAKSAWPRLDKRRKNTGIYNCNCGKYFSTLNGLLCHRKATGH
ncbi:Pentatricopeptide repeat-containing protein At1g62930 [Durusdinium trenchii]|uniref:DNA-directed RNA polymerase n=1 Tax=Durusdinium trenchii TaxID=1381693 RepID=A0ABP0N4D6_9DINO